jgi:hypothetical protein
LQPEKKVNRNYCDKCTIHAKLVTGTIKFILEQNEKHYKFQLIPGFKLCPTCLKKLCTDEWNTVTVLYQGVMMTEDDFKRLNKLYLVTKEIL